MPSPANDHPTRRLTRSDEVRLARLIERGDVDARDRLVEANLGLVGLVARQYRECGVPVSDLVQEGTLGLLQAAVRFDHRRQVRFSTYAIWRIRGRMLAAIAASPLLHLPATADRRQAPTITSLDAQCPDGGPAVADRVADSGIQDPIDRLIDQEAIANLAHWLALLPARHREVVERRYGIGGRYPQSVREIASHLGLGEDRCRQIGHEALRQLRALAAPGASAHDPGGVMVRPPG